MMTMKEFGEREQKYRTWLRQVDERMKDLVGLGLYDLPDKDYYALFDSGLTPLEAAHEVLVEEGFNLDDELDEDYGVI